MNSKLPLLASMFAVLAAAAPAQQTVQMDYKTSAEKATKAYDQKAWGECIRNLRIALQAAQKQRTDAIRAAMPAAPAGMKAEDDENTDNALLVGIGCQVSRQYRSQDGDKSISLRVQADFSMITALLPMFTSPEMVRANKGEMLSYDKQKAVLTRQNDDGKSWKLQIVVDNQHLIEIDAQGIDRAALLKVFDDAAVGKLAKELMN